MIAPHSTILIPGSGPIVIGQGCEFDYSGTQAVKALRSLGHRIVLVNSNPATIMTDPDLADATYIEPLTAEAVEAIIAQEHPDYMLPTVGGQTGLNLALQLSESGALEQHGVRLIGATLQAIQRAEDRDIFRHTMLEAGLPVPNGGPATNLEEAQALANHTGYPLLVRASFALGGSGASWVHDPEALPEAVRKALAASPTGQAWVEESLLGMKEYELEVMRDAADNFVVVCSIENLDPMGIHTGDSITIAPAQTLTDREYQLLRDLARRVMNAVGVETGGANVQFAVDPRTGRTLIIEMNPRVSRSSALASKATGFPIAKIAALVAAGFTLDQITNDITGVTRAAFEPSLDYVVVKIPRWAYEKFPGVDATLGPQMKSVGEVLALGRTFNEALNKAVQSLEIGVDALDGSGPQRSPAAFESLAGLAIPTADRLFKVYRALQEGHSLEEVSAHSGYDLWFLAQMAEVVELEYSLASFSFPTDLSGRIGSGDFSRSEPEIATSPTAGRLAPRNDKVEGEMLRSAQDDGREEEIASLLRRAKQCGIADSRLARLLPAPVIASAMRSLVAKEPHAGEMLRSAQDDGGGEEIATSTAAEQWLPRNDNVGEEMGGGRARGAMESAGSLRSNPVPLQEHEEVKDVRELRVALGVRPTFLRVDTCAAEFEAHTPYLYSSYETEDEARPTDRRKILILGSGPNRIGQGIEFDYCCCQACYALSALGYETIMINCNPETVSTDYDTADRLYFEPLTLEHVLNVVELEQPLGVVVQFGGQTPLNLAAGLQAAGVPILGTSPESIHLAEDREQFAALLGELDIPQPENGIARSLAEARLAARRIGYPVLVRPSFVLGGRAMAIAGEEDQLEALIEQATAAAPGQPILIDRFLDDAYEVDVDALADGERVVIGAVMQHIEEAGVHSGDADCVLPPYKISAYHQGIMEDYTRQLGLRLGVKGLMNVQFGLKDDVVYVIEVNPRASRTVPYASKATGLNMARLAAQIMAGKTLLELGITESPQLDGFFVKAAVLPFARLPGSDPRLGPEMRSTGEVMGHAASFGHAFAKSQLAAGSRLPLSGSVLVSVNDYDKGAALKIARDLHRLGFRIIATPGTAQFFARTGLPVESVNKRYQGSPHTVDLIRSGQVQLILNTPLGSQAHTDGAEIRRAAVLMGVPLLTTLSAASAAVVGIRAMLLKDLKYRSLQEHHTRLKG